MTARRLDGKLLRWSKKGDMVLKNKVKDAILRENTYEQRSLHTTLDYLDKHKTQEEKHLVNKQLQFAATKHSALEKNSHGRCLARGRSWSDGVLADHHNRIEGDHQNSKGEQFNAKLKWKKAISVVRFAVQNTNKANNRNKQAMHSHRTASFLPPLPISRRERRADRKGLKTSKHHAAGDLVLPVIMSKDGKEKRNCLEDPRFLKLKQILSQDR